LLAAIGGELFPYEASTYRLRTSGPIVLGGIAPAVSREHYAEHGSVTTSNR
jgi:hypothetical protein